MAAVDDFADLMEAQLPSFGAVGVKVFTHHMPQSPDEAFSVHQKTMGPPVITMSATIAEQLLLQIQSRARTRDRAERNCYAVFNLFQQTTNEDVQNVRINGF